MESKLSSGFFVGGGNSQGVIGLTDRGWSSGWPLMANIDGWRRSNELSFGRLHASVAIMKLVADPMIPISTSNECRVPASVILLPVQE